MKTILLINDNKDVLEAISSTLRQLKLFSEVETSTTSQQAMYLIKTKFIDIILMDYFLGPHSDENGDGLTKLIRKSGFIGTIIISSYERHLKQTCLDAGADECLVEYEGVDTDDLISRLSRYL